jgi:hypothetical protein
VTVRNAVAPVKRRRDGYRGLLGERNQGSPGICGTDTAAGDEHWALCQEALAPCGLHKLSIRFYAKARKGTKLRFTKRIKLGLLAIEFPFLSSELKMHGPGASGSGYAIGLSQQIRNSRDIINCGIHLGVWPERGKVFAILIQSTIAISGPSAAC